MDATSAKAKPIKALWLTSSYPRSKHDSASVFLRYFAEALAAQNINLQILSPDHSDVEVAYQPNKISSHRFRYFFPRGYQKLAYGSGILPNLQTQPWLLIQVPFFIVAMFISASWRVIVDRPTLIHAHWIFPVGTVAVLIGKLFKIPVLVTAHGGDAFAMQGSLLGAIKRWTIKNSAAWTSNTKATAQAVGLDLPQPQIIPMGIDYKKFASGNSQALRNPNKPQKTILLFVGRLVEKKGVADLLAAVAGLSNDILDRIELWIIGDGAERDRLKALAIEYRIDDKVVFYGRLPNESLPDYYAAADIFIAPSIVDVNGDTEGQGVILLEAMASGTAVISTRTGGISEVIEHGKTGLLVDAAKPVQLTSALEQVISEKGLRTTYSEAGKIAARVYDWENIAIKVCAVYDKTSKISHL